jgi:DNA-binding beta-propeller fold protein YncE/DNA-directed RNA polymerase subunit RPC12/RpoP
MANESTPSGKAQLFHCPTCGASLPVPDAPSVRCEYCNSNVLVPPEYRPHKPAPVSAPPPAAPQPVVIQIGGDEYEQETRRASSLVGRIITWIILLIVGSTVCVSVLTAGGIFGSAQLFGEAFSSITTQIPVDQSEIQPGDTAAVQPSETPIPSPTPPADLLLQFGSEGTGPGQFSDPRHIAVDMDGNIFVADYQDGRLQKFDPSGKFLQLINVPPDRNDYSIIFGIAANYAGQIYVARGGDILVFNTADGAQVNTIPGQFPDLYYADLAIEPANTIYAMHTSAGEEDLIYMDAEGNHIWIKQNFIRQVDKKASAASPDMAVDGLKNVFVLVDSSDVIFKYDSDGQFIDRISSSGDGPGQLSSPMALAVDGKGRIFVADSGSIDIFDNNGAFLEALDWDYQLGSPMGLTFDLQGNLYIVTNRQQVLKYAVD